MNFSNNIKWLLSISDESQVLVVGNGSVSWMDAFGHCDFASDLCFSSFLDKSYDLVIYHASCSTSYDEFISHLRFLREQSAYGGFSLFITADNFFVPSNLRRILNKGAFSKVRFGFCRFRAACSRAGFPVDQLFILMTDISNLEGIVAVGSRLLEVPHYWHPLLRLSWKLGCYHWFANSFLLIGNPQKLENTMSFQAIADCLTMHGKTAPRIIVERIDFRKRGAMILFLKDLNESQHLIIRVTSDPLTRSIVIRNHNFLNIFHRHPLISDKIKSLVPVPFDFFDHGKNSVFIENMLPGLPAWKINRGILQKRIYKESVEFIISLNLFSRVKEKLSNQKLDQLLDEDLKRLIDFPDIEGSLRIFTKDIVSKLRRLLVGQEIYLVIGHGDYGYGNILVEPGTGKLTGVIDWDTGRQEELAGIDLINLYIQKERSERHSGLMPAFHAVFQMMMERQELDGDGVYRSEFGIKKEMIPALLAIALFRYMGRAAQYPDVFAAGQADYLQAVLLFKDTDMP